MKIVYLGTPEFAVKPLKSIIDNGYDVIGVVTNLDKPVGRKQVLTSPVVKKFAESKGIKVYQYKKIREEGINDLFELKPDIMITCAFGQILSKEILDIPKFGVYNIHASLLPKYRGASPVNYAILNGEKETGITIMKTNEGIDTGDMVLCEKTQIFDTETAGELFDRLSEMGARAIIKALKIIEKGDIEFIKQDENFATYTKMIKKEDAEIDWKKNAVEIVNAIRAFNPSPVAFTFLNGEILKVYSAVVCNKKGDFGTVLSSDEELVVGCGDFAVSLLKIQKAGGKPLAIKDFLRGNKILAGTKLGL